MKGNHEQQYRIMPKAIEKVAMIFPIVHLILVIAAGVYLLKAGNAFSFLFLVLVIYVLPVALWRLMVCFYPIHEGQSFIGIKESSGHPWLVAHQLQYLFITFSFFERVLILIPNVYSAWLRLWGSRIGKKVVWTPRVEVIDRTHLDIGDYCVIGDKTYLSSHIVRRKNGRLVLLFRGVQVGERALIGYSSQLLAGAQVAAFSQIPAQTMVGMGNRKLRSQ